MLREHPELTELLCVEVMARQLQPYAAVHQHAVLAALAPWMKNLSFAARWEGAAMFIPASVPPSISHTNASLAFWSSFSIVCP